MKGNIVARRLCMYLSLFAWSSVIAQDQSEKLRNIVPPSPNASSLGKYADWPVSLYTGVPEISIPVYQVKGRSTSVPITLSYHASGIKVSEIASWVGLGFALNAGGVITRSVCGLPDDVGGYLKIREDREDKDDLTSQTIANAVLPDTFFTKRVADGIVDSEPDYFMFNALGRSYKMIFSGDSVVTQPKSNLKFKYWFYDASGGFTSQPDFVMAYWQVWLEDGTKLVFEDREIVVGAKHGSEDNGGFDPTTGWYLTTITSPTGEVIEFNYSNETTEQSLSYSESQSKIDNQGAANPIKVGPTGMRPKVTTPLLSSIVSEIDSVVFSRIDREDLEGGHALSQITTYSKMDPSYYLTFKFNYIYSSATASNAYSSEPEYGKRLVLTKLTAESGSLVDAKIWNFEYNPGKLPSRTSFAQDHYGYYNGAIQNPTLLPRDLRFALNEVYANREPGTGATAQMLKKITYPTGGYTAFNYELNSQTLTGGHYITAAEETIDLDVQKPFHISARMPVKFKFSATLIGIGDYQGSITLVHADIRNVDGSLVYGLAMKRDNFSEITNEQFNLGWEGNASDDQELVLMPGDYYIVIHANDENIVLGVRASVKYDKYVTGEYTIYNGGIRVASIVDHDDITNNDIKRYFKYENPFVIYEPGAGSYQSESIVRTYSCGITGEAGTAQSLTYENVRYYNRFSSNPAPIGSIRGGTVGWGKVTTFYGTPTGVNGRSVSYFSDYPDSGTDAAAVFPYPAITDRGLRRGLLLRKQDYRQDGKLLRTEENSYDFASPVTIKALKIAYTFSPAGNCTFYEPWQTLFTKQSYEIVTEQVRQTISTVIDYAYSPTGQHDSVVVVKKFYFDSPANMQPIRVQTSNSDGSVSVVKTFTALEKKSIAGYAAWESTIDSLVRRHVISQPLQVEFYKDSILTKRVTSYYKKWTSSIYSPGVYLPDSVSVKNGSGPDEVKIRITAYDSKGNLIEQSKEFDINNFYIYDYKSTLPVAEITNSSIAKAAYGSFETTSNGLLSTSAGGRDLTDAFTGIYSYKLDGNRSISLSSLSAGDKYSVSVWGKGTVSVNNTSISSLLTRNGWKLFQTTVTGATSITVKGTGLVDDLRIHPVDARMSTYTYNPLGVTSQTTPDLRTSYFEYDPFGRLTIIRDHNRQIVKKISYFYKAR